MDYRLCLGRHHDTNLEPGGSPCPTAMRLPFGWRGPHVGSLKRRQSPLTDHGGFISDKSPKAFHDTGRHVLSAGHDQVINLASSPSIPSVSLPRHHP